jgi:hypothetical protein
VRTDQGGGRARPPKVSLRQTTLWEAYDGPAKKNDEPERTKEESRHRLRRRFLAFHHANPAVYLRLKALALQAKEAGYTHYGLASLWEVLRWERGPGRVRPDDPNPSPLLPTIELNNDYRSFYARLLMENEPMLRGFFETRRMRSGDSLHDLDADGRATVHPALRE